MLRVLNNFLRARVAGHVDLPELPEEMPEGFSWTEAAKELGIEGKRARFSSQAIPRLSRPGPHLGGLAARRGRPHLPREVQGEGLEGDLGAAEGEECTRSGIGKSESYEEGRGNRALERASGRAENKRKREE